MIIFGRVEILNLQLSIKVSNNTSVNASVTPCQNFRMADARYPRSKSPKRYKTDDSKPKNRKKQHSRKETTDSKHHIECKTPPLPSRSSLADLLKQRHNLKQELDNCSKQSKYDLEISHKFKDDNVIYNNLKNSQHALKRSHFEERDTQNSKKHRKNNEDSPELEENHSDSEDEENIIEQRRKQRKQLLEKLTFSHMATTINNKDVTVSNHESVISKNLSINETNIELDNLVANNSKVENCSAIPNEHPSNLESVKETNDMFSEKEFISNKDPETINTATNEHSINISLSDNWDDAEGYYKVQTGDIIDNNNYTVKRILGQGVFANVVLALDNNSKSEVAIKIMRTHDIILETGLKELAFLKEINKADPDNIYHCVRFIRNFIHRGHLCVVIEPLYMDMRKIIKKYGKHGLNLKAVMSYSRQLLLALRLLKKLGIVHADVKPDNVLVNEKKNVLKLCDFGSAIKVGDNESTPYLVSRFYRAPEIILGIPYNQSIDIWSAACTIYEMATGRIMFTGSSNNKMLKCFMDLKGKVPSKMLRKGKFKEQHFNYNNSFLLHKKDKISGREKFIELSTINPTRDLWPELIKSHKNHTPEIEEKLTQLQDLLEKMLMLDRHHRLSINECLKHPFIREKLLNN